MYIIILSIRMGSFLNGLFNTGIKGRWSVTIVKLPPIRNTLNLSQAHLAAKASPSVCEYLDSARVVERLIYIIGRHFPFSSCSIVAPRPVLWKSTCTSVGLPISKKPSTLSSDKQSLNFSNALCCPLPQVNFTVFFVNSLTGAVIFEKSSINILDALPMDNIDRTSSFDFGSVMVLSASTLLGSGLIPSFDTVSPKKVISDWLNLHLLFFRVSPASDNLLKTSLKFFHDLLYSSQTQPYHLWYFLHQGHHWSFFEWLDQTHLKLKWCQMVTSCTFLNLHGYRML